MKIQFRILMTILVVMTIPNALADVSDISVHPSNIEIGDDVTAIVSANEGDNVSITLAYSNKTVKYTSEIKAIPLGVKNTSFTISGIYFDSVGQYIVGTLLDNMSANISANITVNPITSPTLYNPLSPTNKSPITITGSSKANRTINVSVNGAFAGTTTANEDGNFSLSINLNEGINTITAIASNNVGTSNESAPVIVILDTTAPNLSDLTPSGTISDNTPLLSAKVTDTGSGVNASSVVMTLNGTTLPATYNATTEIVSYQVTTTLTDGTYTLEVSATDNAGNSANANSTFTVDATAPTLSDLSPSGTIYDNTPLLSAKVTDTGSGVNASSVVMTMDGAKVNAVFNSTTGIVAYTPAKALSYGVHNFTVSASDEVGNSATNTSTFTIEKGPNVTITSPTNGLKTNTPNITVTGSTEANATVEVFVNGMSAGNTRADLNGSFTILVNLTIDGEYTIFAIATDEAGHTGDNSNAVNVTLDTIPPNPPTLDPLPSLVNTLKITVSGTSEVGTTVEVFVNDVSSATTTTDSEGKFSVLVDLKDRYNNITARATDEAGNIGNFSASKVVEVDIDPPVVTIYPPLPPAVNTTPITISGIVKSKNSRSVEANARVEFFVSGVLSATTTTDSEGYFSASVDLTEGLNSIKAKATDEAGNIGDNSSAVNVTLDTTLPTINFIEPSGDITVNTKTIYLSANAIDENGVKSVEITVNNKFIKLLKATSGNISISRVPITLSSGTNVITLTATDNLGNTASNSIKVTILPLKATITTPIDGGEYSEYWDSIKFNASVEGGVSNYQYYWTWRSDDGLDTGSRTSKTFTKTFALKKIRVTTYTITLTVTDGFGNVSEDNAKITVYPKADLSITPNTIDYSSNPIDPGDTRTVELEVKNLETNWDILNTSMVIDDPRHYLQNWTTLDKWNIPKIAPGGKKRVTMTIAIPIGTETGTYIGDLIADSLNGGTETVSLKIGVTDPDLDCPVDEIEELDIVSSVKVNIQIENIGTGTVLNVTLEPSENLKNYITFNKQEFNVKEGSPETVIATISQPLGKITGTINIYSKNAGSDSIKVTIGPIRCKPEDILLKPNTIKETIKESESVTRTLTLNNTGTATIENLTLEVSGTISSSWINLSKDFIDFIPKGGKQSVTYTIEVPENTPNGVYDDSVINVKACDGISTIPVSVTVVPCIGINISDPVGILSKDVPVGEVRSKFITLKNTGCKEISATLSASGDVKDWITFDKTSLKIGPKGERTIRAKIKVPSDKIPGTYTGQLTVKGSTPRGDVADTIEVKVEVVNPYTIDINPTQLNDITAYVGLTTPRTLYIKNNGSGILTGVHLSAEGGISDWIKFKRNDFSIEGFSYKYVTLEVTPSAKASLDNYTSTIVATTDSGEYDETVLYVTVVPAPEVIINPDSLSLQVPKGHTYNGVISITDLSGLSKQVNFYVTGEIAYSNVVKIDKPNYVFVQGKKTARLGYNVTVPATAEDQITGYIELSGDVNRKIPVTINTILPTDYISVKDQIFSKGVKKQVPIDLSSEKKIGSMDLKLNYDPTVIKAINVTSGTLTSGSIIASNLDTSGEVSISLMDLTGISGTGTIAQVTFDVIGNVGDKTPLTLSSVEAGDTNFNSVALSKLDGTGTIGIVPVGEPGDLNGDGEVTSVDALRALQMAVELIPIDPAADVSCDGKVTSVDALMILQKSVGLIELQPCQ